MARAMKRWEKLAILAALLLGACKPADPSLPGGCRNFNVGTWGEDRAPWQDFTWAAYLAVDEPLLSWGQPGDLHIVYPEINERLDALRARFAATIRRTWVNWSSEEADLIYRSAWANVWDLSVDTDVVSIDDYAGPQAWWIGETPARLGAVHAGLRPGQTMALVPEAFPLRYENEDDLILMNRIYFDWALRHDRIEAFVPFLWTGGIDQYPKLQAALADLAAKYPRCPTP